MLLTQYACTYFYENFVESKQNILHLLNEIIFIDRFHWLKSLSAMSTAFLTAFAIILCILFRILNVNSQPQKPTIWCENEYLLKCILKISPVLKDPYIPTRFWGFSGHVQTLIHSIVGRVKCPWPLGERCYLSLQDGSTLSYDLYQPLIEYNEDLTIAVCPGIGNSSESVYVRTFVHYAQCHGFRCAVLNHIGALNSVQVTSSRIFTYGHTSDFAEMVESLSKKYVNSYLCLVGFSLGGNLVTKYLGEKEKKKPNKIIGAISVCQGYNAVEGTKWLLNWQNFRRFYLYVMTENMKNIIMRHRHVLLTDEIKSSFNLTEKDICASATLPELDEAYTRKIHKFSSVNEFYKWSSCINYLENIESPIIFINSKDDPLVPEILWEPIKKFTKAHNLAAFVEVAHGGHLGFYEGGLLYPNPVTWLDRALLSLIGSILNFKHLNKKKSVLQNFFEK